MTANSDRRLEILRVSARLFSQQGVAGTTVREIAEAVGINSGTLYYYFKSKDEIASEILIRFLTDLTGSYVEVEGETARAELDQIVSLSLSVAAQHPYATEIYQSEFEALGALPRYAEIDDLVHTSHQAWAGVIDRGVQRGELRADFGSDLTHQILREVVWAMVRWNRENLADQATPLATLLTSIFVDGLGHTGGLPAPLPVVRVKAPRPPVPPRKAPQPAQSETEAIRAELREVRQSLELLRQAIVPPAS